MKKILPFFIAVSFFMTAYAQKDRQHTGFYLSMGAGPVFGPISMDSNQDGQYDMNGAGAIFDLKIGGAVKENVILHATLLSNGLVGPTIKNQTTSQKASNNLSISEALMGAGITYYIMPSNLFLSGSAGMANFTVNNQDMQYNASTDYGFGFQLKVGKEWWVSRRWGLGVAASYGKTIVDNQPGNNIREKMNSNRVGIMFNATLN